MLTWLASHAVRRVLDTEEQVTSHDIPPQSSPPRRGSSPPVDAVQRAWLAYWVHNSPRGDVPESSRRVALLLSAAPPAAAETSSSVEPEQLRETFWRTVVPAVSSLAIRGGATEADAAFVSFLTNGLYPSASLPLQSCSRLTCLHFSGCALSASTVTALAAFLAGQLLPALQEAHFDRAALDSHAFTSLLAALTHRVRGAGGSAALQHLSAQANCLRADVLAPLAIALFTDKCIRTVDLGHNPFLFSSPLRGWKDSTSDAVAADTALTALLMGVSGQTHQFVDEEEAAVSVTHNHVGLSLAGCPLSPSVLATLSLPCVFASLPLRTLDLSHTSLGAAGVQQLIALMGTHAASQAATSGPPALCGLETLRLRGVGCGPADIADLAALLSPPAESVLANGPMWRGVGRETLLPSLRRLDVSQNDLSAPGGAAAATDLITAWLRRFLTPPPADRECASSPAGHSDELLSTIRSTSLFLEACHLSDAFSEHAHRHISQAAVPSGAVVSAAASPARTSVDAAVGHSHDFPPLVPTAASTYKGRFVLFLGTNTLSRAAILRFCDALQRCIPRHVTDVYVEGNPVVQSHPEHVATYSVCSASPLAESNAAAHVLAPSRHLHSDALAEVVIEAAADADGAAGPGTATSRRASLWGLPSSTVRTRSRTSRSPSLRLWRSPHPHPSVNLLLTDPAPAPRTETPVSTRDSTTVDAAATVSGPRERSQPSSTSPSPPRVEHEAQPLQHGFDADEVAQLIAETEAIMRARLDVMAEAAEPFYQDPLP